MTARIQALTVVLDRDYREDDVESIVTAIRQLRGVAAVKTHEVTGNAMLSRMTIHARLGLRIHQAIARVLADPSDVEDDG